MDSQKIGIVLGLLVGLFCLRVIAQLAVYTVDISFLPPFEAWHSGTMPYGLLVFCQAGILLFLTKTALRFLHKQVVASQRTGVFILIIGSIYFFSMVLRMALGLTVYIESRWFSNYLSTAFHYVLAIFLLLVGWYHRKMAQLKSVN